MKRQSLEEKLFSYQSLSASEKRALDKTVKQDPELAALQEGWLDVEAQLSSAHIQIPAPGFKQRWLARHEDDLLRQERIQAAWITFLSAAASAALLALLLQRVIPSIGGAKQLFFGFLNAITEGFAFVQIMLNVSISLLQKLPTGTWASVAVSILLLPMLWYAVFRELSFTKGVYK